MADLVLRVISGAGRSRIEISSQKSFLDLKNEIASRLSIQASKVTICKDASYRQQIQARDADQLSRLFKNGDMIYIANQGVQMANIPVAETKKEVNQIDSSGKGKAEEKKDEEQPLKDSFGRVLKKVEEKKDETPKDSYGRIIQPLVKEAPKKEVKMIQGTEFKKTEGEDDHIIKHQSFDNYLREMMSKCKDKHLPHQKCQDCSTEKDISYKVKYDCKDHRPFPQGMCQKCLPPTVVLQRQTYRHVDYVSFMNFKEVASFVGAWQQTGMFEQRMGWLYGYYSEDPNFPDGVRVNVEAIYEPPQIGDLRGVKSLEDPWRNKVDMIAESLSLERVGWIFTSKNDEKTFMTSSQMREMARLQQEHLVNHPLGHKISKFVTVRVEQQANEQIGVECWMTSDICQALERDNCFGESTDPQKLNIREPKYNEAMPAILREGSGVKEFEVEFMLISLAHGQPNANNTQFNVLKRYDYPVMNRFNKKQSRNDYKNFVLGSKALKTSYERFACFQFLLHLTDTLDIDTAMSIAHNIVSEQAIDSALIELLETI